MDRDSDPTGWRVPSPGNSFSACLVVEGVFALWKRKELGAEDIKGKRKMKGSHGTLSCSESLYLESDTSLTGPEIHEMIRIIYFAEK